MAKLFLALVVAVLLVSAGSTMLDEVTCQDAVASLLPCLDYLKGQAPNPSAPCCVGVQKLNGECALKPDRVKVCECLKDAAPRFGVDQTRAKSMPALCNVHLPFTISINIDCSKVSM